MDSQGKSPRDWLSKEDRLVSSVWCREHPISTWHRRRAAFSRALTHVTLTVVYTWMVITLASQDTHHVSHALRKFYSIYMGVTGEFGDRTVHLNTAEQFDKAMIRIQQNYFDHHTHGDMWDFPNLQPREMTVELTHNSGMQQSFNISKKGKKDVHKDFYKAGLHFAALGNMDYTTAHVFVPLLDYPRRAAKTICYQWLLDFELEAMHSGQVDLGLRYSVHTCRGFTGPTYFWLAGVLAVLAASLEVRSVWCWWRRKQRAAKRSAAAQQVPLLDCEDGRPESWWECLEDFDAWHLVAILGNIVQVAAAVITCFVDSANVYMRLNLLAVSAALAWVNMVRYLAFFKPSYTLYMTLAVGVPKVMQFMLGVIPVFVAYAIIGVGLWGFDTEWFSTFSMSSAALFSLLNGDILHDSFLNLRTTNWFLAQVYLYSFLCLFIYVVLNIFITIIEESYYINSQRGSPHHLGTDSAMSSPRDGEESYCPLRKHAEKEGRVQARADRQAQAQPQRSCAHAPGLPKTRDACTGPSHSQPDVAAIQAQLDLMKSAILELEGALKGASIQS